MAPDSAIEERGNGLLYNFSFAPVLSYRDRKQYEPLSDGLHVVACCSPRWGCAERLTVLKASSGLGDQPRPLAVRNTR